MSTTPWAVRQSIATRIATLVPASSYRQSESAAWRLSLDPVIQSEPGPRSHLAYWVDDRVTEHDDDFRGNPAEGELVTTPLDVLFLYRLRARKEAEDWDGSAMAGHALAIHLIEWPGGECMQLGQVIMDRDPITPDWILVRVSFIVSYTLSLTAS